MATTETKGVKTGPQTENLEGATGEEAGDAPRRNGEARSKSGGGRKPHGKGSVYIGLKECDEALRKIDHLAKQMSIEGFARALGHDAPKGRFLQKLEAMKAFTLIETDDEHVRLTQLATDMLYGGSEAARAKARSTAFLAYPEFKKVFQECPKGQDHARSYIDEFVRAKLSIVNEVDRFIRLFIESAHFAGLLDGEPTADAKTIRVRHAPQAAGPGADLNGDAKATVADEYAVLAPEDVDSHLEAVGLGEYRDRSDVRQRTTGTFKLTVSDGKVTVEISRPVQIVIKPQDLITELPAILSAMKQKGFQP
jgi:hypothetical protein